MNREPWWIAVQKHAGSVINWMTRIARGPIKATQSNTETLWGVPWKRSRADTSFQHQSHNKVADKSQIMIGTIRITRMGAVTKSSAICVLGWLISSRVCLNEYFFLSYCLDTCLYAGGCFFFCFASKLTHNNGVFVFVRVRIVSFWSAWSVDFFF